jgi:hypothetical protein
MGKLIPEVGAGAFFGVREREAKKRARKRKEKRAQKTKMRIRAFFFPHSGNPVSEPKAA